MSENRNNFSWHEENEWLFEQICKRPMLSREEEVELLKSAKAGSEEARHKLIEANLRLVIPIARKYSFRGMDFSDLMQEGVFGLSKAISKFDFNRCKKFSTYATWWVRKFIGCAVKNQSRLIRLPEHTEGQVRRVWAISSRLQTRLGHLPSAKEIGVEAGLSSQRVSYLFLVSLDPLSLNSQFDSDGKKSLGDFIVDRLAPEPEQALEEADQGWLVDEVLINLDPSEAEVIRLHFGIGGHPPLTLRQIGKKINKSHAHVRNVELNAIRKARRLMKRRRYQLLECSSSIR